VSFGLVLFDYTASPALLAFGDLIAVAVSFG